LIEDGNVTFRAAIALAQNLPHRPKPRAGLRTQTALGTHYDDEAFKQILTAAIKVLDIPIVSHLTGTWKKTGDDVDRAVVDAWLDADHPGEAIAVAHNIENQQERVKILLHVAQTLLDRGGAPIF
jgi:hypothetical protein